jgi:hypothetical protein
VNGTSATEHAHVEIKDLATDARVSEAINLPGPAQGNVDHDGGEHLRESGLAGAVRSEAGPAEVAPGELEHEERAYPVMSRTETTDSVEIIGDVLA